MSKSFDPYAEWLKIPADQQPPTYYALLGVEEFEADLDKIEESFQELYSKVRRYQVGDHSADAVRILTEMSRAYDCLTSPHHKKKYDREIRGGDNAAAEPTSDSQELKLDSPPPADKKAAKKKKPAKVELLEDEPIDPPQLQVLGSASTDVPTATLSGAGAAAPSPTPAPTPAAKPATAPATPSAYETVWYIQTPDGRRLGPATQQQLDEVVASKRVNPQSMVWRVGWPEAKPIVQMFPNLTPAAGAGAVGPYQKLQVRSEVGQSRKAIFFFVLLLGVICLGFGLYYGFAFTLKFALMAFVGLVGAAALAAGLLEMGALLNSPIGSVYRQRIGDEPTRKLFAWVGGMCVLVSISMIGWQAARYMMAGVRGISRNISQLPTVPKFNVPGASGGANSGQDRNRPTFGGPPGFRGGPARTGPGSGPSRSGPSGSGAGGQEVAASGTQPRIRGFSTYELLVGKPITLTGNGLAGTTKVIFAKPGNAKSSSTALEAKFEIVNDSTLKITRPLQMRFGKSWVCEVHSNGGVAVAIPPDTIDVEGNTSAPPATIVRLKSGAQMTAINNSIAILEGNNRFTVMLFTRAYVLGSAPLNRGCNANVLIGRASELEQAASSNTKIMVGGGITVFQQPQAFTIR